MSTTIDIVRKPATASNSGELTDQAQTIAGAKTFAGSTTLDGAVNLIKGRIDGAAVPAGYVGETIEASTTTAWSASATTSATVVLSKGKWAVSGGSILGADATNRFLEISISLINNTAGSFQAFSAYNTSAGVGGATTPTKILTITSDSTPVYLVTRSNSISGVTSSIHVMTAIRIA